MRKTGQAKARPFGYTVTHRDEGILVLIPAVGPAYDGAANFRRSFDKLVIAGGRFLPSAALFEEAKKRKRYLALVQLWNAHRTRNLRAIRQAMEKLYGAKVAELWSLPPGDMFAAAPARLKRRLPEALRVKEPHESDLFRAAPWHLPEEFSHHLRSARFVLWWNWRAKKFVPALYCRNIGTALYALAALREMAACPMCDMPFLPGRKGQEYCSIRCRERFRQQRRREKLKKLEGRL